MKTITKAYKCDHCGKLYQRKHYAAKHEDQCKKNPENDRPCFGCHHMEKMEDTFYHDYGEHKVSVLRCLLLKKNLISPMTEKKGNAYPAEDLEHGNELMPKLCEYKQDWSDEIGQESYDLPITNWGKV